MLMPSTLSDPQSPHDERRLVPWFDGGRKPLSGGHVEAARGPESSSPDTPLLPAAEEAAGRQPGLPSVSALPPPSVYTVLFSQ